MELRHLRYFLAVAEEEHYRRAADRLRIAQPALSRQIQDLEEELGFKLFQRLPRGVKLSTAGKSFLQDARDILRQLDEAANRGDRISKGLSGTLRLGFTQAMAWHGLVPESFLRFRQAQPDVQLQINALSSLKQIEAIRSGRIDAGFIYTTSKQEEQGLAQLHVASHKLLLAIHKDHPLARLKTVRLRNLQDVPFVWPPRHLAPEYYDAIMLACARGELKSPRIVQSANDYLTTLSLVSCGLGVAFVVETAPWFCPAGVSLLPVNDLDFTLRVFLVWREDDHSTLLHNFLADVRTLTRPHAQKADRRPARAKPR